MLRSSLECPCSLDVFWEWRWRWPGSGLITPYRREQLENDAGLRVLGFLPVIESWRAMVRAPLIDLRHFSFSWPRRERLARIFDDRSGGAAEMLFGLKLVIDDNVELQSAKVIGITSPRAGDGKTTLAFNLASSIAAGLTSLQAEVAHIMAVVRTRLADMDVGRARSPPRGTHYWRDVYG